MWSNPIIDRTELDVINKVSKAYLNASDLNRIEDNCQAIASLLGVTITTAEWTVTDYPTASQFERILSNISTLREAYATYATTPITPTTPINIYSKVNSIEQILADIYDLINKNLQNVIYVGERYVGEVL